jgi:hypothetical protein
VIVRLGAYDPEAVTMCAVCRRNLLAGERFRYWHAAAGRRPVRVVCSLCEGEAARGGWFRSARRGAYENAVGLRNSVRRVA